MARLHDPSTGLVPPFPFPLAVPLLFPELDVGAVSVCFRDGSLPAVARIQTKVFFFLPLPEPFDNLVLQQRRQLGAIRNVRPGDE